MRRNLTKISLEMKDLLDIKKECDELALKGARRFAIGGFGGLSKSYQGRLLEVGID